MEQERYWKFIKYYNIVYVILIIFIELVTRDIVLVIGTDCTSD